MEQDPYFWTSNFEPQNLKIEGVDFRSAGAPTVGYAFSLLYDVQRLLRRGRRETIGALHGLHLKRVIKHVAVSSVTTDQKVIVPLGELERLAHEQAETVYRKYCSNISPLTMEAISYSFADNGCLTVKDVLKMERTNLSFRVYPEVVGCGEKTSWTSILARGNSDTAAELLQRQHEAANEATFVLDDWFGDGLIFVQRNYLCTEEFLQSLQKAAISGFRAHPVTVARTGKFPQIEKVASSISRVKFYRLEIGTEQTADMFHVPHVALFFNESVFEAVENSKLRYAVFIEGHP